MSKKKAPRVYRRTEPESVVNVDVTNPDAPEPDYALQMPKDKRIMLPKLPLSRALTKPEAK